ncbi:MAG: hypothetical protein JXQ84_08825 [Rhodospirillaceae bacterium]|nr:hypothetical protein [Rhodospirillaceae bacterium]
MSPPFASASVADPSARFLQRLMAAVMHGHRLDDPRDSVICRRWVEIVDGIPDGKLFQIIPQTVRGLFRDPEAKVRLERCGLRADLPLRVEAIAPYVISFRRFMAARTKPNDEAVTRGIIAGLRLELRRLKRQFDHVFDHAAAMEAERERLSVENKSLHQEVLSLRLERDEAQRQVGEARSKAFRFLRLYLFMLKEELQRRRQDPIRMVTVEVAIETNLATLEALGWQDQAKKSAREILGPDLYAVYFDGGDVPPLPPEVPRSEPADAKRTSPAPYFPLGEIRRESSRNFPQNLM